MAYENQRRLDPPKSTHPDFKFVKKGDATHYFVGASPRLIKPACEYNPKNRGYFIKCSEEVAARFKIIPWYDHAVGCAGGGVSWFNKEDVVKIYELYESEKNGKGSEIAS